MPRLPIATLSVLTAASLALIFGADDPIGDARRRADHEHVAVNRLAPLLPSAARDRAPEAPWAIIGRVAVAVDPDEGDPPDVEVEAEASDLPRRVADVSSR